MAGNAKGKRVFVGMSGGVDSSVAALLLKKEGYDVTGVHLICWEGCENSNDRKDAMRVAARIDIPFSVWDFKKEYKEKVFDYMIWEYKAGRTPNPDVMCNREIKFGIFLKKAFEMGADCIATGHYVKKEGGALYEAKDKSKDQSYFLWGLGRGEIAHALFPIGDYLKLEVREIARQNSLVTADKKDSQGLCFVGNINFQEFLREYMPELAGEIVTPDGKVIGQHLGAHFFTPGQRHGIKIGGGASLYVAEKNVEENKVLVAPIDDPALYKREITVSGCNISGELPDKVEVRIRYRQPKQTASVYVLRPNSYTLVFENPQRGVAPGQSAVFYDGERMLGGGVIS